MSLTIYHNPRCSKSRQTLELIRQAGIEPVVREYLHEPLSAKEINSLLIQLGLSAREIMRKGEETYKQQELSDTSLTDDILITAIVNSPILLERPIVSDGNKAIIGRPPENVNQLI